MVQYLGYGLAPEDQSHEARKGRIEFWRDGPVATLVARQRFVAY